MRLMIPDPTPDEPTVAAPSVCPTCEGYGVIIRMQNSDVGLLKPCYDCTCERCGQTTDTPPLCRTCDIEDDARYERRRDV